MTLEIWNSIVQAHEKALEIVPEKRLPRDYKRCTKCQRFLSLDEFFRRPGTADGYRSKCKVCFTREVKKERENDLEI